MGVKIIIPKEPPKRKKRSNQDQNYHYDPISQTYEEARREIKSIIRKTFRDYEKKYL